MKQFLFLILLLASTTNRTWSQNPMVCRLGFAYDISLSPNWGKGKPVITKIYPYSSAEQAGLQVYDIIEAIENVPVTELTPPEITAMMNPADKNEVALRITNLRDLDKTIVVTKDCKRADAITEEQLAVAFSMYSPENTSERLFVCPFKTAVRADTVDFRTFRTFGFEKIDDNNRRIELAINSAIEKELKKKGLIQASSPDISIQTYYSYQRNPNYRKTSVQQRTEARATYRYDFALNKIERFPFLDITTPESDAEYTLQLGVRLIDRKIKPGRTIWETEANELMEAPFKLESYAQSHIPLMFMQYPYVKYSKNVTFLYSQKSYNYTGLNYDAANLSHILNVELNSPAHAAGIRMRDIVEKIDNQSMEYTAEEFTAAYKQFIMNTMSLRDESTVFTDANGFKQCMFWNKLKYIDVMDAIQNPHNKTAFAYIYKYAPYISPSGTNVCIFVIRRGKDRREVIIRPSIHSEMTIEIK
ncbi:MAG: DUF4136 domain-containing protein [Tannerellaceae bacterium]|jgi:hypothetical protein|nr:DUF4136 domain-containing protein [Tannerellaceae bacterium]